MGEGATAEFLPEVEVHGRNCEVGPHYDSYFHFCRLGIALGAVLVGDAVSRTDDEDSLDDQRQHLLPHNT